MGQSNVLSAGLKGFGVEIDEYFYNNAAVKVAA